MRRFFAVADTDTIEALLDESVAFQQEVTDQLGYQVRRAVEVLVQAPPVEGLLAPGNTVQVVLPLGTPQRRLSVPRDALIIRADGLFVFRVTPDLTAERVEVKSGTADGDWIAVDGKLSAGDTVVVRGGELLRGSEKVQVVGVFEDETAGQRGATG